MFPALPQRLGEAGGCPPGLVCFDKREFTVWIVVLIEGLEMIVDYTEAAWTLCGETEGESQ